ncbi:S66 family peptidase [Vibrio cholerae]|uniref:S66 family peptidase n=1 Tax=Vibrio cholerae TaxID=666 RepID=UPI0011DA81BF|nr:S66 peptidase family protein [Vibrio cholerae]TXY49135.1 LD-carboxypeptidase [Vibrio cholerae]GHW58474.1 microcin immunity protein MccF [Vibrio cholerae]
MLYAKALSIGDKIGFFSPSSPATAFAPNRFQRAKAYLKAQGFELVEGSLTGKSDYYRSGSIRERAEELNQLIRDPNVRCIMSTIGGNNSNSLLPYIDYEALRNDPKIIIGYSDVTALLLGIYAQTGLITFYGPALVASFGEYPPLVDETFHSFIELLCSETNQYQYTMPSSWTDIKHDWETQHSAKPVYPNEWQFIGKGKVTGRIIGGNLNTMAGIWGSRYMPEIEVGDILLIEDSLKGIENVERSFAHLAACGVFERVSAIILGKHELFDNKGTGRTPLDVLIEVLADKNVPIFYGFDSCHTHPMLVTPLGVRGTIDFDNHTFKLEDSWVKAK